jgi:hypothetical protein
MRDASGEAIERLLVSHEAMSDWERGFLASVRQSGCRSAKQKAVLATLVERYMRDSLLAGEILGQERLFR